MSFLVSAFSIMLGPHKGGSVQLCMDTEKSCITSQGSYKSSATRAQG